MATATAPVQQIGQQQLTKAYAEAEIALNKARNELLGEEKTLAATTAQFNEQCKLQAAGKKADPQAYRDSMTKIEQRIIGLKSIVADRQSAFDQVAGERSRAAIAVASENERQRVAGVFQKLLAARDAVSEAMEALKRAQINERTAAHAWRFEGQRAPALAAQVSGEITAKKLA
jgi:hypothetical protein